MSELREECYKCLKNSECIPSADYGSIYCMIHRKFDINSSNIYKTWEEKANKYDSLVNKIKEKKEEMNKIIQENKTHKHTVIEASIVKSELQKLLKEVEDE